MIVAQKGVVFVDLDGTLSLSNTFHTFIWACWTRGGTRLKVGLFTAFALRILSHADARVRMKRRVLTSFHAESGVTQNRIVNRTVESIRWTISTPVLSVIREWQEAGQPVVLATAAPDCYAGPLAELLGLSDCIATPSRPDAAWREMFAEEKARACDRWRDEHQVDVERGASILVITDHADDLPLLATATSAIVQASSGTFDSIARILPSLPMRHVDPTRSQDGGGGWLWIDDHPSGPHDRWEIRTIVSKYRYALVYCIDGRWRRINAGSPTPDVSPRLDCPPPPPLKQQMSIAIRRRVVRDYLGIFH